ncbi:MAG: PAS domain-containing protein, partial [Stellaceae bacterium]
SRSDIDPTEVPRKLLPHLQIIDVIDAGARFRYRLVGTALVEAFGSEYTGKYLDEMFSGERYAVAHRIFEAVCSTQRPVFQRNRYQTTKDVDIIANRVHRPLSEDQKSVSRIFGALTFEFGRGDVAGLWGEATLDSSATYMELVDLRAAPNA